MKWSLLLRLGGESLIGKVFAHILNCCYPSNFSGLETTQKVILSNGFKHRDSTWAQNGVAGDTFIYLAFAETPFKYSNAL